jgi:hypothetical protein
MSALRPADLYFESLPEPNAGCLQALRAHILAMHPDITEEWKYKMPFYYYRKKMFCYIRVMNGSGIPYIGIANGHAIQHEGLIQEDRKRMKVLLLNASEDLPLKKINAILTAARLFQDEAIKPKAGRKTA